MNRPRYDCAAIDQLLCDYLDQTLPPDEHRAVDTHLSRCPACAALAADCREALAFLERCESPAPPRELLTRIIHQLPEAARSHSPLRGWRAAWQRLTQPVLQPKFAMGMAMTILSFSMLGKFVGPLKPITAADLDPARVVANLDDKLHRAWSNVVKYYESLRVVYEIQTRLREWSEEEAEQPDQDLPGLTAPSRPADAGEK